MVAVRHALNGMGSLLIQDPPITQFFFQNIGASIICRVIHLYIGYEWTEAG